MAPRGRFLDDIERALGRGMVTSGHRTQEEQDDLRRRGATRTRRSSHTYGDGYDVSIRAARDEQELNRKLAPHGLRAEGVIRESGKGGQGTGPHFHFRAVPLPTRGRHMASSDDYLDQVQRVDRGGQSRMEQVSRTVSEANGETPPPETPRIFMDDDQIRARADRVQGVLNQQDQFLEGFEEKLNTHQATVRAATEEKVQATRAINEEISAGTQALTDRVKPIFAQRQAIADQLDRINTMNPLERGIRGLFDLNYDRKHLEGQLDHFDRTLAARGQDYQFLSGLQERSLKLLEAEFGNKRELANLDMAELDQDGQLLNQRLSAATQAFQFIGQEIAQEREVIVARATARADVMGSLQAPEILQLLGKAKANGGIVNYNGVPLTAGELQEYADRNELQDLQIEGARLARQSQKLDVEEKFATRLGRSLTEPQIQQAIQNGGVYKGVKIPQDVLTQALLGHRQRSQLAAEDIAMQGSIPQIVEYGRAITQRTSMTVARARSMFGGRNVELEQQANRQHLRVRDLAIKLKEAKDQGASPVVLNAIMQEFQRANQGFEQAIDQTSLKYAGGDRKSAGYIASFLRGQAIDSQAGVDAMVHFATKGSLPSAMRTSPAARAAFAATQQAIVDADNDFKRRGVKPTVTQRNAAINQRAAAAIPRAFVGQNMNQLIDAIPQMAKIVGDKMAGISAEEWQRARQSADIEGRALVAHRLGVNPGDIPLIMNGSYRPQSGGKPIQQLQQELNAVRGEMVATQHSAFLRNIDQMPTVVPGQANSTTLMRFVQSPKFASMASRYEQNGTNIGFGDFLVGSASQGQLTESIGTWAQSLGAIANENNVAYRAQARQLALAYSNQPMRRAAAVLGAIPGIDKHQEALLLAAIGKNPTMVTTGGEVAGIVASEAAHVLGLESTSGPARRENDRIATFIKTTRFRDPALEAVRKTAAAHWDDYAISTDGVMDRLVNFVGGN